MTNITSIAFLDKLRMDFFLKDSQAVLHLEFAQTIMHDLEIINKDDLVALLKKFLEVNKIPVGDIIIILSDNLFFMKDFPPLPLNQQKLEVEKYIDIVPFENI